MQLKQHNRYDYVPITERPDFSWPEGKRLAFYVALNVEHFSFGEGFGHTPTALGPPPDQRNFAWRDYGLRVGIWRIFDLMDELGLPLCHLLNSSGVRRSPKSSSGSCSAATKSSATAGRIPNARPISTRRAKRRSSARRRSTDTPSAARPRAGWARGSRKRIARPIC